jgi:hypothetical protein
MKYNRSWKFAALANELRTFPSPILIFISSRSSSFLSNVLGFGSVFNLGYYVIPVVIFFF